MALQRYVIRKISALSIIASAVEEHGAWRFSFDATDPTKEYLVEETKQDDYDWVILPIVNFNAYYRATTFEKNYLPLLPKEIFVRETFPRLCRFKVVI